MDAEHWRLKNLPPIELESWLESHGAFDGITH